MTMRAREILRRRWVRVVALVLLLPLPAWILICNLALWTGAISAIVTRDGKVTRMELDHGFAWMVWPTVVHLKHASLRIDSYSYQLAVEADEAVVDLELLELFDRRVHIESFTGSGVRAEYRDKVDPEEEGDPDLAAYPRFDGTEPQVQPSVPKPVPPAGKEWAVDLDDVDAEVERLWIDEFDVEPCGHVRAAFHWIDADTLSMPTTTVRLADAGLWIGAHEALRGLAGDVTVTFAPFDSGEVDADHVPAYLSFDVEAEGELIDPAALSVWWPDVQHSLSGAPGPIAIAAKAQDGVLQPGTRIHHRSAHGSFVHDPVTLRGAPEVIVDLDDAARPRARVWLRDASLHGKGDDELARSEELHAELIVAHGNMAKPWSIASASGATEDVRADDLRRISAVIDSDSIALKRGRARGSASAEVGEDLVPHGRFDVHVEDGILVAGDVEVGAALHSRGRVTFTEDGELVAKNLELRSRGVTVKTPKGTSRGTWVKLDHGSVRVDDERVVVETRGEIEDARPAVVHLTRLDPFLRAVPDLQRQIPIRTHTKVEVRGDVVDVELIDVEQLGLHVSAAWRKRGEHWRLALLASGLTALGFTMSDAEKLGKPFVLVGQSWFAEQRRWVHALAKRSKT
ncbi:MAG TPA: hypothetical protein VG755_37330 [Nannocystaceae bacterium]|nr:hypothetical protein [Nannocystaceae bacterium]